MRYERVVEILSGFALVFALAASLWLTLWPYFYAYVSTRVRTASGAPETVHGAASLVEVNGASVFLPLAAPVALTAIAFAFVRERQRVSPPPRRIVLWAVGALLPGFCVLTGFSIGTFYLPAAILSLAAAVAGTLASFPKQR